jgi:hypothetical protein
MKGLGKCGIEKHLSFIQEHGIRLFAGEWMELENFTLSEGSQVQKSKGACFPSCGS